MFKSKRPVEVITQKKITDLTQATEEIISWVMEWLLFNNTTWDTLAMESEKQEARNNVRHCWSISEVESYLFP